MKGCARQRPARSTSGFKEGKGAGLNTIHCTHVGYFRSVPVISISVLPSLGNESPLKTRFLPTVVRASVRETACLGVWLVSRATLTKQ